MTVVTASPADRVRARADELRAGLQDRVHGRDVAVRPDADVAADEDVNSVLLLDMVASYLDTFAAWPSEAALSTAVAWVVHAVARERDETGPGALIWRASPRLLLTSKERGSGKSTALDLLAILTGSRFGRLPKVTAAAFAKLMGRFREPAFIDEAKLVFGTGQRSQELQGMILAGYTPRSNSLTAHSGAGQPEALFGPVAYAGKDNLITAAGDSVQDLLDRSIIIRMRAPEYPVPEVDDQAEDDGAQLAAALVQWTDMMRPLLRKASREIAAEDREAAVTGTHRSPQIWRPLRAVARVAGGDWPERIEAARDELAASPADTARATAAAGMRDAIAGLQLRSAGWGAARAALLADDELED